jgi:citrate lyase subunit beta/citryl-CoA lyase
MVSVTPLFVPGTRPERFPKAAASGADSVIIDFEDAVAPEHKLTARACLRAAILPVDIEICVRINPVRTPWHLQDIEALAGLKLSMVMLAKTESAGDIGAVAAATGLPVIALIETAVGLAAAREIANEPATMRLAFGSIDFCTDIGASHTREALLAARCELVLASRLANLPPPIDGVTTALDDAVMLQDDAAYALNLGFGGKLCIHPRQIAAVRTGFMPTDADIGWARRILAVVEGGAVSVDGTMVDAPVRLRARQILARARVP